MNIDLSPGYKIRDQYAPYFLTFQVLYWIDIFSRRTYRDIFIDSLKHCQKEKRLKVHAYVIMTNHVHLILSSPDGNLSNIIRDIKSYTSKTIIDATDTNTESRRKWMRALFSFAGRKNKRNSEFQFWTQENHPEELISKQFTHQKLNYIHRNPVEAGFVFKPEDWIYSSASNYAGIESIMQVELIE
jgi:REP element-mobilizing transposase RayT